MKEYDWVQPTLERISDLLKMPGVHNSHGTPKMDPALAWMAIELIAGTNTRGLPAPAIFPMAGGLTLTWHGLETECCLSISGLTVHVFAKKGALVRDFGEFSGTEQQLSEALHAISFELFPGEPAP